MRNWLVLAAVAAVGTALGVEITAKNYVQAGLVAHWDALENAGYGVHSSTATTWKDLSPSGFDLTLDGATWRDTYLKANGNEAAHGSRSFDYKTIEILFSNEVHSTHAWLFGNGSDKYCVLAGNRVQWINNMAITSFDRTKDGDHGLTWVNNKAAYLDGVAQNYASYSDTWGIGKTYVVLGKRNADYAFTGRYYTIRLYNRDLSAEEVAYNSAIDQVRYLGKTLDTVSLPNGWTMDAWGNLRDSDSAVLVANPTTVFVWTGNAGTTDWHTPGNWANGDGSVAAIAPLNSPVAITGAVVQVNAAASASVLELGPGAGISVAAGERLAVKVATVEGAPVARTILSGNAANGLTASWVSGDGTVNVAGAADGVVPTLYRVPAADGWYEFGLKTGYGYGRATGSQASPSSNWHYIDAERPDWGQYAFPAGAKLRLVGGILLDTVPDWFSEIDQSQVKLLFLNSQVAFANGTALKIPKGANFRYQPATWIKEGNRFWLSASNSGTVTSDIEMNGTFNIYGDGTHLSAQTYAGRLTGNGAFYLNNYSNQGRFQGAFDFTGSWSGFQNANLLWLDTPTLSGHFTAGGFSNCSGQHGTNSSFSANGFMFGVNNSATPANRELLVEQLTGNARDVTDVLGKRWRSGGHIIVWGSNTVHVGKLWQGLHVVARRQDQHCTGGFYNTPTCKGNGYLVVDEFLSGNIYASTNIFLTVGTMAANTMVDYTYQSGAINMMTLDITNSCNSSTTVKATDLAMLPARLSGFAGKVKLTVTASKDYTIPVDLSQGTNTLYQTVGCIGSGMLDAAPATGTINATVDTTRAAVKGEYALARFTSGGSLLSNWTITVNGKAEESFLGMKVTPVKDATGIWLKVRKPGVWIVVR